MARQHCNTTRRGPVNMTTTVTSGAVTSSAAVESGAGEAAMATLMERRRRRREALNYRTRWTESVPASDGALWHGSVANPDRVRLR